MSYTVPTQDEAVASTRKVMRDEMPGTDANIFPNTNYVLAKVIGGEKWQLFQYLKWIARQRFVHSADGDQLDAFGVDLGMPRRSQSAAFGLADVVGTAGHIIAQNIVVARSDGIELFVKDAVTLDASGTGAIDLTASISGVSGNTVPGTSLTPIIADAAVAAISVDTDGIGGGAGLEADDAYRSRLLFRLRNPPHGGAAHDYVAWALDIPGVTRVWVDPLAYGPGTVGVWFMADDNGSPYGLPSGALLSAVTTYIQANKPVTARVVVQSPKAAVMDVTIDGIGTPSTDMQAKIEGELKNVFRRQVQVSLPNVRFEIQQNIIWQAVARATGDSLHKIKLPVDDVLPAGSIPVLGKTCYV